ncbi:restriction endonuclease subunit S [Avibacterium avium]|uniref:restriction endonuclease subunit S n=1 Tax=Avibacterium avium TaxID=751 RepID=UPI003BF8EA45
MSNIPKLRFPEFTDAWEKCKLGEVAEIYDGTHQTPNYKKSGIMFLSVENIETMISDKFISEDDFKREFKTYPTSGDVLMTRIGDIGTVNIVNTNQRLAYYVSLALLKPKLVLSEYLKPLIESDLIQKELWKRTLHVAFPKKINKGEIEEIPIIHPTLPEQQKIGALFRRLDRLITLHKRKWDDVILLKKALLQKMFPKNGSDFPALRFPEFTDAWEKCKLENFVEITTGKLDANAMVNDGKYDFYTSGIKKFKINIPAFTGPAITIAGNGATVGFMHLADGEFNAYQRTYVLTKFSNSIREFLFYEIGIKLPRKISAEARTGNIPYIVMDMLTNLDVFTPTVPEQQKIGTLFRRLDRLITLHKRQHEHYQLLKKALLQQMFV